VQAPDYRRKGRQSPSQERFGGLGVVDGGVVAFEHQG
jgi:hypothetical protein